MTDLFDFTNDEPRIIEIISGSLKGDQGDTGVGLIVGGSPGQVLAKISSSDYDLVWQTIDKDFIGLDDCDNTSDLDKPISDATQVALDLKANIGDIGSGGVALGETSITAYRGDRGKIAYDHSNIITGNPHSVTKANVGLGSCDNTSDANKPLSNAVIAAIAAKADLVTGKVPLTQLPAFSMLSLGETAASAYRGDRGKTAYNHTAIVTGNPHSVNKNDIGLGNCDNTSDNGKPISALQQVLFDLKADLVNGIVPLSQLPESLSVTVEEYANLAAFPATGDAGTYYKALDTGIVYLWSGTEYTSISGSLVIGETSSTAYRGDRGKSAYDHTLLINNPHATTKTHVGLGNCDNTSDVGKPISTLQQAAFDLKANLISPSFTTPTLGVALCTSLNGLIPTSQSVGFTFAGGTTSKTLTVLGNVSVNQDLLTTSSPEYVTAKLTSLTDGYIPKHTSDAVGLANSNIFIGTYGIGINTASPATGAVLDITGTGINSSSIIIPRDTTTNRPSTGVEGMLRYNSTLRGFEGYQGATPGWLGFGSVPGGSTGSVQYYNSGILGGSSSFIYDSVSGAQTVLGLKARTLNGMLANLSDYDHLYLQGSAAGKGVYIGDTGSDHPLTVCGLVNFVGFYGLSTENAAIYKPGIIESEDYFHSVLEVKNASGTYRRSGGMYIEHIDDDVTAYIPDNPSTPTINEAEHFNGLGLYVWSGSKLANPGFEESSKDITGTWTVAGTRTRIDRPDIGASGLLSISYQYGYGCATNEFQASNPNPGSNAQATQLCAILAFIEPQMGHGTGNSAVINGHTLYYNYDVMSAINMGPFDARSGLLVVSGGSPAGKFQSGIDLSNVAITTTGQVILFPYNVARGLNMNSSSIIGCGSLACGSATFSSGVLFLSTVVINSTLSCLALTTGAIGCSTIAASGALTVNNGLGLYGKNSGGTARNISRINTNNSIEYATNADYLITIGWDAAQTNPVYMRLGGANKNLQVDANNFVRAY